MAKKKTTPVASVARYTLTKDDTLALDLALSAIQHELNTIRDILRRGSIAVTNQLQPVELPPLPDLETPPLPDLN